MKELEEGQKSVKSLVHELAAHMEEELNLMDCPRLPVEERIARAQRRVMRSRSPSPAPSRFP